MFFFSLRLLLTTQQTFVLVKTYWRRLEDIIARRLANTSWRRLEDVLKTTCKTSWRRFRKTYCKYVFKTSSRRLQDLLEDEKCYAEDVLKTSWKTRNVCWVRTPFSVEHLRWLLLKKSYYNFAEWSFFCATVYLKNTYFFRSYISELLQSPHQSKMIIATSMLWKFTFFKYFIIRTYYKAIQQKQSNRLS